MRSCPSLAADSSAAVSYGPEQRENYDAKSDKSPTKLVELAFGPPDPSNDLDLVGLAGGLARVSGIIAADGEQTRDRMKRQSLEHQSVIQAQHVCPQTQEHGTQSLQRTKASIIYNAVGKLRAVQRLLGHVKIESTVRYLSIEVEDALELARLAEV